MVEVTRERRCGPRQLYALTTTTTTIAPEHKNNRYWIVQADNMFTSDGLGSAKGLVLKLDSLSSPGLESHFW